jgi:hypothetical protein
MNAHHRSAFTLVELLVVIGILMLLLAMILPAVQRVRESANRMSCASKLRQLGIGAHNYHNDRKRLPFGYLGPSPGNEINMPMLYYEGQWIGHFPLLLPYLEQDALHEQIKVSFQVRVVTAEKWFWSAPATGPGPPNAANYTAAMKDLNIFHCPSAANFTPEFNNPSPGGGGTILGLHVFNRPLLGPFTAGWKDEYGTASAYRPLGRTNYMGVAGCGSGTDPFFSRFEGIYTNRSEKSLGQISVADGTSHTLMYGETCGTHWTNPVDTMDICWMAGGGLGTYLGLLRGRETPLLIAFSANHTAGVQFCFADGSVRTVRYGETRWDGGPQSADWFLLQQLAGWRDGGAADVSSLVD